MHYIGKSPYRQHDTALHSATQCCAMLPIWGPYIRVLLMQLRQWTMRWGEGARCTESTPFPLMPGTAQICSGECFRCGAHGHIGLGLHTVAITDSSYGNRQ